MSNRELKKAKAPTGFGRWLRLPLFLLLFPLFIVLNIENNYHHMIEYRFVWKEILLLCFLPLAGFLLAALGLRSWRLAALFAFPLYAIFYFGGPLKGWADKHLPATLASFFLWLPLLLLFFTVLFIWLRRRRPMGSRFLQWANGLILIYIVIELVRFAGTPRSGNDLGDPEKTLSRNYTVQPGQPRPDIYYIVMDGYTTSPVLQLLGRDNRAVDTFLRDQGFYVADHGYSNYNFTAFSLGCTFNLDYLNRVDTAHFYYDNDYLPAVYTMYRNEWRNILQKEGYHYRNFSNFPVADAPVELPAFDVWFQTELYRPYNFLHYVNKSIGWHLPRALWIRTSFQDDNFEKGRHEQLKVLPARIREAVAEKIASPKFVYAHFLVPHGPFSYDTSGNLLKPHPEGIPGYLQHVGYANKLLRETVQTIFREQDRNRPFVIILQGDHGIRHRAPGRKQLNFQSLNAFYFSNGDYRGLQPNFTNVNTFRVVANTWFGQKFPMLPGRTVYLKTVADMR
ncbi:MAG: hypothetical protein EOO15_08310 [Chitinophagaceae bacterium]|nr:MAG: hypothetical protein EOO15_08310 [Chitinophagaceae bacterium]